MVSSILNSYNKFVLTYISWLFNFAYYLSSRYRKWGLLSLTRQDPSLYAQVPSPILLIFSLSIRGLPLLQIYNIVQSSFSVPWLLYFLVVPWVNNGFFFHFSLLNLQCVNDFPVRISISNCNSPLSTEKHILKSLKSIFSPLRNPSLGLSSQFTSAAPQVCCIRLLPGP